MSTPTPKAPAPPAVAKILAALEPHAVTEECLYLHFSRLDAWQRADLARFFRQDDSWRLFAAVRRRLGVPRLRQGQRKVV
jgi:hypothetical protein